MERSTATPGTARPVALVTGGGARIGAAVVRRLHARGYDILLHFNHSQEAALGLAMALNTRRDGSVHTLQADLEHPDQIEKLVHDGLSHWGRLDLLVNNASCFRPTSLADATDDDWHRLMDANARAPFFLIQQCAPALTRTGGNVVNLIDIHAHSGLPGYNLYSMSKGALATMTRVLARELGPVVRVNGVSPGAILWPEGESQAPDGERRRQVLEEIPLGRLGEPDDIASAVLFLADQATYITGQIIAVDGGRSLRVR